MPKRVLIYIIIIIQIVALSLASHDKAEYDPDTNQCISGCTEFNPNNPSSFDWEHGKLDTVPPDKLDFAKIQEFNREAELTKQQLIFKDSSGNPNINKVSDWKKLDKNARDETLKEITGKSITTEEPFGGKVIGNGVEFEAIKFWKIDKTSINNCIKCSYDGIKLKFKHADSILTDKSASTNIDNFDGYEDIFSVEKADSFLSDCIRVDNIKDSEFRVSNIVEITTKSNVNLKIADCSYNEVIFSGKGKVTVDKNSDNPKYIVENGTLTKKEDNYNETIESNNSIIIETDKTFGFKCLTINPVGSYFYNDKDLRKDFVINVPKESSTYKLCLRKNSAQQFTDYNGLVDFIDKKIELNGVVNYLRYPLKNNQISSLLSDFVYRGLKNVKTLLNYDENLLFLKNIGIKNVLENKQQITITKPNSYYAIKELEDGKIHRVVELNKITKNQLTQDISTNYESDSLGVKITIINNVLIQDNGQNRITILPLEHSKISSLIG